MFYPIKRENQMARVKIHVDKYHRSDGTPVTSHSKHIDKNTMLDKMEFKPSKDDDDFNVPEKSYPKKDIDVDYIENMKRNAEVENMESIDSEIEELQESIKELKRTGSGPQGYNSDIEKLQKQIYDLEDEASEIQEKMEERN